MGRWPDIYFAQMILNNCVPRWQISLIDRRLALCLLDLRPIRHSGPSNAQSARKLLLQFARGLKVDAKDSLPLPIVDYFYSEFVINIVVVDRNVTMPFLSKSGWVE